MRSDTGEGVVSWADREVKVEVRVECLSSLARLQSGKVVSHSDNGAGYGQYYDWRLS